MIARLVKDQVSCLGMWNALSFMKLLLTVTTLFFLYSEATILTSQAKVSVIQGVPVQIDVQYTNSPRSFSWTKDGKAVPSGWTQAVDDPVISLSKQSPVYSDIGKYTLNVSTPSFSNPSYQSTTATITLDVFGKCRFPQAVSIKSGTKTKQLGVAG